MAAGWRLRRIGTLSGGRKPSVCLIQQGAAQVFNRSARKRFRVVWSEPMAAQVSNGSKRETN